MKLYNFRQNNSGGQWDESSQIAINMLIEASNYDEANDSAEQYGIYFNGCSAGYDCECCGDRWSRAWDDDVDEYSVFEFTDKEEAMTYFNEGKAQYLTYKAYIYFKDGTKEVVNGE